MAETSSAVKYGVSTMLLMMVRAALPFRVVFPNSSRLAERPDANGTTRFEVIALRLKIALMSALPMRPLLSVAPRRIIRAANPVLHVAEFSGVA